MPSAPFNVTEIISDNFSLPRSPIVMLAEQLQRIANGTPTAVVFSHATHLPDDFDPSNPPDGMSPNSEQSLLVDRFYRLQTSRLCKVDIPAPDNSGKTKRRSKGTIRCPESCCGFRDMLAHQVEAHDRQCNYLCLLEDCLAPFHKVGNAKRHFTQLHSAEAIRRKQEREEKRRSKAAANKAATTETTDPLRVSNRISKPSVLTRSQSRKQILALRAGVQEEDENSDEMSGLQCEEGNLSVDSDEHENSDGAATPSGQQIFSLRSEVREYVTTVRMRISQDESNPRSPTEDIQRFHNENVANGTFIGECETQEQREWIAAIGLLDINYNPKRVDYEFTKD